MTVLRLSEADEIHSEVGRQLVSWLSQYKFFSAKRVELVENHEYECKLRLYTANNVYSISASCTHLGCTVSTRTSRPGENWTRGNDLPDGKFGQWTLIKILAAIVFYEAREVVKPRKPVSDVGPVDGPSIETDVADKSRGPAAVRLKWLLGPLALHDVEGLRAKIKHLKHTDDMSWSVGELLVRALILMEDQECVPD